jgi:predicted ATP-grasp superfamily ATP-dependent carboligase
VTYGWCRTAYAAVGSLSRRGYEVYSCSSHGPSMSSWSRWSISSEYVPDPFTEPVEFTLAVVDLVGKWSIDIVLPGHEDALVLRGNEDLLPDHVLLATPGMEALELGFDKAAITRAAIEAGVPVPATRFPSSINEAQQAAREIGFPLVVKVRRSNSGKGVSLVGTVNELDSLFAGKYREVAANPARFPLLQEFVDGQVVGACFLARAGEPEAVFQERYLRCKDGAFGTSVYRVPMNDPRLDDSVDRLVRHLCWTGLGHFDFILPADGSPPVLLEMNPRLWGAINLALINGFDFPAALIAGICGQQDLGEFFCRREEPLASLWLVGEGISALNQLRNSRGGVALTRWGGEFGRSLIGSRFDDFAWSDPLPLIAEAACYAKLFVKSGGSTNPAVEGMFG